MPVRPLLRAAAFIVCSPLTFGCAGASKSEPKSAEAPTGTTESAARTDPKSPDAVDAGGGSTSLALEDASVAPKPLEPLPNIKQAVPDAGHVRTPSRQEPGRTVSDVQKAVVAVRDQARACYDAGEKQHSGLEGDLVMTFTIDPKGAVGQVAVDLNKSAIVDEGIVSCVSNVLKKLSFPPSHGGFETHANYPFTFHAHRHNGAN